jgi:beta-glucosidase
VTFYKDDSQIPDFLNYEMKGRTYRFMEERPLFDFGFGLSYTTFEFGEPKYKKGRVSVKVTNTGKVDGEEVVQVYLRRPGDTGGPNKTLRAYKKVSVPAGKTIDIKIDLPRDSFEWWDTATNTMRVQSGEFEVMVGNSSRPEDLKTITVKI